MLKDERGGGTLGLQSEAINLEKPVDRRAGGGGGGTNFMHSRRLKDHGAACP